MVEGLGAKLRKRREDMHLAQKDVAKSIGASPALISNFENSTRTPSVENLIALANLLGCSTDYLLGIAQHTPDNLDTSMLTEDQQVNLQTFLRSL